MDERTTPATQLTLIDGAGDGAGVPVDWRLDDETRELGRRGVELARRALQDAASRRSAA